jgi:hypothetical protein
LINWSVWLRRKAKYLTILGGNNMDILIGLILYKIIWLIVFYHLCRSQELENDKAMTIYLVCVMWPALLIMLLFLYASNGLEKFRDWVKK